MTEDVGYKIIYVALKSGGPCKALYLKRHVPKPDEGIVHGTSLFVAGLPLILAGPTLKDFFKVFGSVAAVHVHSKRTSAVVLFESTSGADSAMQAARKGVTVEFLVGTGSAMRGSFGLRRIVEDHKALYPGNEALMQQLNSWMANFEQREEERRQESAASAADGWTVVSRKAGRKRRSGVMESGGVSQAAAQAHAERKKPKCNEAFYRVQARENRKSELLELRRSFAVAKNSIKIMRESRKFRDV